MAGEDAEANPENTESKITSNNEDSTGLKTDKIFKSKIFANFRSITSQLQEAYGETLTKLRKKLADRKKKKTKKENDRISTTGDIFITRSSIDFERIKSETTVADQIHTYPIIGACVIAIPYALKQSGFPFGLIILLFSAIMVEYSEVLLVQCSVMASETCLQNIGKLLYGNMGLIATTVLPYLYSLSVLTTYNIILADLSVKIFRSLFRHIKSDVNIQRKVVLTLMCLLTTPIATTTNVRRIFKWSLISLVSASFVTIFIAVRYFTLTSIVQSNFESIVNTNLLQATGVMTFCFSCQHTCRLYYTTIDNNQEFSGTKPTNIATSYSLLCTLLLGISGYMTFKEYTQGNILENYCEEDSYATLSRLFFALFIICLYPMECQTLRQLIQQTVVVHKKFEQIFNIGITVAMLIPPYLTALSIDCLAVIIEIAGLLFAIPLVYILPPIFFLKLSPNSKLFVKEKLPCLISIFFGCILTICGLTVTLFTPHKCFHDGVDFAYCNISNNDLLGPLITLISLNGSTYRDPHIAQYNATNIFYNMTSV